jgi:hypothetical protein
MTAHADTSASNKHAPNLLAPGPLMLVGMILLAALSRLLPHPPNFSPVEAIALFGGAYFASRAWAVAVPLVAMLVSDIALGLTMGGDYWSYVATSVSFWSVYLCIALSSVVGFGLRGRVSSPRVLGYGVMGSVLFFLVTNFAVWTMATPISGHNACVAGLSSCYVAAIPFFKNTLFGTLVYSAVLFGGFELLRRRVPSLRVQTV